VTNASQTPEQPPEAPPVHSARFDTINPVLLRKSKITAWLLAGASTLLAAAVAAGLVFGLALPLNSSGRSAAAWIEHTLEVITAVKDLQVAADDIETGQRGFLLTRNPSYLGPYDQAAKVIWHQYSSIRDLVGDNPSQIQNLNTLSDDLRDKMAELDRTIGLARGGDFDRAIEVARTGEGKRLMDDLRTVVRDMTAEEQRLLKVRRVQVEQSDRRSRLAFILLAALAISGFWLSSVIVVRRRMVAAAEKQAAGAQVLRQRLLDMVNVAAVMVRDGDGTILFWSEGCRRLYGWTAEQAVGRSAVDLLKSVFPGSYTPIENELLGSGTWHGELRQRRQDNVEITVSVSKALHNYEDGSGSVVMENMIDVSALRDVERELLTSEAQFHALVDTAADAFVIADAEGRIEFVNAAGLRMFGYGQSSELIGRSLDVMMTATDAARHDGYIAVRRDGAGAVGLDGRELLAVRRDGSKFPIEISVSSFDINGSHRLTGIIRDTTVRKRAEEALRDSEARLRLVQEVGGIAYFDRKEPESASVISAETACMYGLPPTQARMSPEEWLARIHPEDRSRMADERNRLLEHGGIWTAEFRICRGDGAVRSVAMRAGVFPETDGGPPRLIAAQQDITDMVAARQVLALHRQDLEQQVTERTAALAEAEARFRGIFDSQFSSSACSRPTARRWR